MLNIMSICMAYICWLQGPSKAGTMSDVAAIAAAAAAAAVQLPPPDSLFNPYGLNNINIEALTQLLKQHAQVCTASTT